MSDPTICAECKGAMKPLFTGFYCPNDCDRPHLKKAAVTEMKISGTQTYTLANIKKTKTPWGGFYVPVTVPAWPPPPPAPNYTAPMADDQCRDFYCSGKGKTTHMSFIGTSNFLHYKCGTCSGTWSVSIAPSTSITPVVVNWSCA